MKKKDLLVNTPRVSSFLCSLPQIGSRLRADNLHNIFFATSEKSSKQSAELDTSSDGKKHFKEDVQIEAVTSPVTDPAEEDYIEHFEWREVARGLIDIQTWLTAIAYLGLCVSIYSYSLFLYVVSFYSGGTST
jgi:hypothetical protein